MSDAHRLMEDFQAFALPIARLSTVAKETHEYVQYLAEDVKQEEKEVLKKVSYISNGIRAGISLLESKRSIEAESVTRLTELAFIFIPLTFVSSIFNIQVNKLSSGVPFSTFVAVAGGVTLFMYIIRLVVQSRPFITAKTRTAEDLRKRYQLNPMAPISLRIFLKFAWRKIGPKLRRVNMSVAACDSITLVAMLWKQKSLDISFRVTLTIMITPAGLATAYFFFVSNRRVEG